ncbi:MAG: hypothetical protein OEW42_10190 [Acidimicrobiia bacterium]|nr:hypothetical protein [Acidimicrobiia bacterium]
MAPVQRLAAIEKLAPTDEPIPIRRPLTPLRDTVLMTSARDQPAVGREIEAEVDSADRIDHVLAFIRWTGIRELLPHLGRHVEAGKPLRIILPHVLRMIGLGRWLYRRVATGVWQLTKT